MESVFILFSISSFDLQGTNVSEPNENVTHTGEGGICTPGSQCPNGTTYPIPCLAGYYAPNAQMDSCLDCPAGMDFGPICTCT